MDENRLKELAKLFLKLGTIGFGGPAVHIAMMQEEVVVKKKWISEYEWSEEISTTLRFKYFVRISS